MQAENFHKLALPISRQQLPIIETNCNNFMQLQLYGCDGDGDVGGFKSGYCNQEGKGEHLFSEYSTELTHQMGSAITSVCNNTMQQFTSAIMSCLHGYLSIIL